MTSIREATEPTPKNLARMREAFIELPDSDLIAMASAQPDTAKGAASAIILAERRAAKAEADAERATARHNELMRAVGKPHWSQTPTFIAGVIAAVSGVVAVWPKSPPQAPTPSVPAVQPAASAPLAPNPSSSSVPQR